MGLVSRDIPGKKGLRAQGGQHTEWATILCFQGSATAAPSHPVKEETVVLWEWQVLLFAKSLSQSTSPKCFIHLFVVI